MHQQAGTGAFLEPGTLELARQVAELDQARRSGRVYAAYGGVYVATALVWLRVVDGVKLSTLDWAGAGVALLGMSIIVLGWHDKA